MSFIAMINSFHKIKLGRGERPLSPFGTDLNGQLALAESTHEHTNSFSGTPPQENKTDANASTICKNFNNSCYRNLCSNSGNDISKSGRRNSGTCCYGSPFLLNLMGAELGLEPKATDNKTVMLPLHYPAHY